MGGPPLIQFCLMQQQTFYWIRAFFNSFVLYDMFVYDMVYLIIDKLHHRMDIERFQS